MLTFGYYYRSKIKKPSLNTTNKSIDLSEPVVDTKNWQTFSNAKYDYTLRFPADYEITQFEGFGIKEPATIEANTIRISKKNSDDFQFSITANALETLSKIAIRDYFSSADDEIHYDEVNINGASGYKVTLNKSFPNWTYYFIQKQNGSVIKITVANNSEIDTTILSTISFP